MDSVTPVAWPLVRVYQTLYTQLFSFAVGYVPGQHAHRSARGAIAALVREAMNGLHTTHGPWARAFEHVAPYIRLYDAPAAERRPVLLASRTPVPDVAVLDRIAWAYGCVYFATVHGEMTLLEREAVICGIQQCRCPDFDDEDDLKMEIESPSTINPLRRAFFELDRPAGHECQFVTAAIQLEADEVERGRLWHLIRTPEMAGP